MSAAPRVLGLVTSCFECPNRAYETAGEYLCTKTSQRLPNRSTLQQIGIPGTCPLTPWPKGPDVSLPLELPVDFTDLPLEMK